MNSQTIYQLWEHGTLWGHCYSAPAAYRWKRSRLANGADSGDYYITKSRLPLRVPIYGPLEPA